MRRGVLCFDPRLCSVFLLSLLYVSSGFTVELSCFFPSLKSCQFNIFDFQGRAWSAGADMKGKEGLHALQSGVSVEKDAALKMGLVNDKKGVLLLAFICKSRYPF
jgi:hypothetical protein